MLLLVACDEAAATATEIPTPTSGPSLSSSEAIAIVKSYLSAQTYLSKDCLTPELLKANWSAEFIREAFSVFDGTWLVMANYGDPTNSFWRIYERSLTVEPLQTPC